MLGSLRGVRCHVVAAQPTVVVLEPGQRTRSTVMGLLDVDLPEGADRGARSSHGDSPTAAPAPRLGLALPSQPGQDVGGREPDATADLDRTGPLPSVRQLRIAVTGTPRYSASNSMLSSGYRPLSVLWVVL